MASDVRLPTGTTFTLATRSGAVETRVVRARENGAARPILLIGLHGYGMEASQVATLVHVDPAFGHSYLAPQGFELLPDGSRAWFPIAIEGDAVVIAPAGLARFLDRFEDFVAAARAHAGAAVDQTYIIGYSQGGAAAIALAALRPTMAAGFVSLAGSVLDHVIEGAGAVGGVCPRLFIGHGTRDSLVPTAIMRDRVDRLRQRGLALTYREYAIPHVVSEAERRDVAKWLEDANRCREGMVPSPVGAASESGLGLARTGRGW